MYFLVIYFERQVEVLAQVEDVEGQPAHNEEEQGGQQQGSPPHIAPLTQHPSAGLRIIYAQFFL